MKKILRSYVVDTASLYLLSSLASGIIFEEGIITVLKAGAGLTLAFLLVKPIINILLLPLNLVTFGLFRWISSAIALYLVTLVVPGFKITTFSYQGLSTQWFDIPALHLSGALAFICYSLVLSVLSSIFQWFCK